MKVESPNKRIFYRGIARVVVAFLALALLASFIYETREKTAAINMTELAQKVTAGEVMKIVVSGDNLEIELKNAEKLISKKETETGLTETLVNYGVNPEQLKGVGIESKEQSGMSFWLSIILPALLPLIFIVAIFWFLIRQAKTGVNQAFTFGRANVHLFGGQREKITFADVAGLKEAKKELEEIVDFLKEPKKYLEMGAKIPRGVLLMGPPGTGKTLLARAVAGESGVPFFHISASEFVEMFVGVGAARTRDAFATAKKAAPSILFVDEIDAVGRERGAGLGGGHDEREQTLNQILVEMDGFDQGTRVIVLAASVTGDTPVLIRENGEVRLKPIAEIIDGYYAPEEENREKLTPGLEVLGFEKKPSKRGVYFEKAAFKKVRSVFRHKVDEIYEVEFIGGRVRTTGNHSVFVRTTRGVQPKPVAELRPGEILVDLPYKVNRTNKKLREIRAAEFNNDFELELSVWQPLFETFEPIRLAYEYALANKGVVSQMKIGEKIGFSQAGVGKWQRGISGPRVLSRNYYKDQYILPEKVKVTSELMRLFGYYVAEGYSRKELDFCFNQKEVEMIGDLKKLVKNIFNLDPSREKTITKNAVNIVYHSKPLAQFFAYHCGRGAKNKYLPTFLFEAPKEYFVEFLKGYAAGDGHLNKRGGLEVTSVGKQLIEELHWLSRMHGYKSYINSFTAKEGRRIVNSKPLSLTVAWRLGFSKGENPLRSQSGEASSTRRAIIKSVKKIPFSGYVYDFCGCENEAFFGGRTPVLLHNTNRPDVLDAALLRPGRFDRRVVLDLPDIKEREEILKIHAKGKPLAKDVDFSRVAARTPGFSGADLANLVNEAAILAVQEKCTEVGQLQLYESIEKVILGPARRSRLVSDKEKEITAYHEAGHALVAAGLKDADPISKVSIIARGQAGGYTINLPLEDRRLVTKSQFLADLAMMLGGYASEKIIFKEITTGASNDLKQASTLARRLVTRYGMSEKMGPLTFGKTEDLIFLGREITTEKNYSEEVAAEIDKEVRSFIDNAYRKAVQIVTKNKAALKAIAKALVEKEVLEQEEFYALIKPFKLKPIKA